MSTPDYYSVDVGDNCPKEGCDGSMVYEQEFCSCAASENPPCSGCENSWIQCDECGEVI